MRTSSDAAFSAVAFPRVDGAGASAAGTLDPAALTLLSERAQVRGHAAGYAEGLRQTDAAALLRRAELEADAAQAAATAKARLDAALATLSAAAAAVHRATLPVLEQSDSAVISAAIELAEAVIGRELSDVSIGAHAALQRVLGALASDAHHPDLIVRMHPDDVALLREAAQLPQGLTVHADGALRPGDAVAVLADGFVDARIHTALDRAKRALREESV